MWVSKLTLTAVVVLSSVTVTILGVLALRAFADGSAKVEPKHDHMAHPGDPVKQEEHTALFELVADSAATHRAVADGAWGNPKTWDKGTVPGAGAKAVIPSDRTVTVAGLHDKERVDWVRVDGTLRFDPRMDTALKVTTLVGNVKSTIEIGTDKERIQADRTARLILGDRGLRDEAAASARSLRSERRPAGSWPRTSLRRRVHQPRHAHLRAEEGRQRGSFRRRPRRDGRSATGFSSPDSTGSRMAATSASIRGPAASCPWASTRTRSGSIQAVSADGQTFTLDRALTYQHGDIYGYTEAVPVGNLSRNVVVESENTERSEPARPRHVHAHAGRDHRLGAVPRTGPHQCR